jgi:hypothetical protein
MMKDLVKAYEQILAFTGIKPSVELKNILNYRQKNRDNISESMM